MKKGITMRVQVYIEGEDEPAHDFTQTGEAVVTEVFQGAFKAYSGPYTIKVLKMEPVEGGDDDDDTSADALDVKPLMQYTPAANKAQATTSPAATSAASTATSPAAQSPAAPAAPVPPPAPSAPAAPKSSTPSDEHEQPKHHFWDR